MIKDILIRLFVKIPLYIIWICLAFTIIIPIGYWVITGNSWSDIAEDIDFIGE